MRLAGAAILCTVTLSGCAARSVREPVESEPVIARPVGAWDDAAIADLRAAVMSVQDEGLAPETAALAQLDAARARRDASAAAAVDDAADALLVRLAAAFARGAVDPAVADPAWFIVRPPYPDLAAVHAASVERGPSAALRALLPDDDAYRALRDELVAVRGEEGGARDGFGRTREERIRRLRATMERRRWLPRALPARRIEVRIPHFELVFYHVAAQARRNVIVGARRTPTPSFSAEIESITLNPTWTPPSSILVGELLPRFRRDPEAAAREGFEALDASGAIVEGVDWAARPFPYAVRQRPGAANALGRVRFDLPNPYAVFLHDTPQRGLFAREARALSHGCIRVADPVSLAAALLADWPLETLDEAIAAETTRVIPLAPATPVYVLYLTAAMNANGDIAYAEDIYGRDAALLEALDALPRARTTAQSPPGRVSTCS